MALVCVFIHHKTLDAVCWKSRNLNRLASTLCLKCQYEQPRKKCGCRYYTLEYSQMLTAPLSSWCWVRPVAFVLLRTHRRRLQPLVVIITVVVVEPQRIRNSNAYMPTDHSLLFFYQASIHQSIHSQILNVKYETIYSLSLSLNAFIFCMLTSWLCQKSYNNIFPHNQTQLCVRRIIVGVTNRCFSAPARGCNKFRWFFKILKWWCLFLLHLPHFRCAKHVIFVRCTMFLFIQNMHT